MENKLYYDKPADCFEEALLIGNGRLGAIVYGKTDCERISLNEETLWTGRLADNPVPMRAAQAYIDAKNSLEAGDIGKAEYLTEKFFTSEWTQIYSSPGYININFNHDKVSDYTRTLNLENGIIDVSYKYDGCFYNREIFAPLNVDYIAMKFSASQKNKISFRLDMKHLQHVKKESFTDSTLIAHCYCPSYATEYEQQWCRYDEDDTQNIHYLNIIKIEHDGGILRYENDSLFLENADTAYISVYIKTNFAYLIGNGELPSDKTVSLFKSYNEIKKQHTERFSELYNRVKLRLGEPSEKTTDSRLRNFDKTDLGLYELLFNYGRYLLISSSYNCTLPSNLQGIWNENLYSPWCSNFTLNINLQMNYWHSFSCNLAECFTPFVSFAKRLCESGKRTAREYYNSTGSVCHSASDIWAHTNPIGRCRTGCSTMASWNLSLGWIACQLYDAYLYNKNEAYLQNDVYPIIEEASRFYSQIMSCDSDGYYILSPSSSPENSYILNGKCHALDLTAQMSMSITDELFGIFIQCERFCTDSELTDKIKQLHAKIRPMKIRKDGRISEWYHEYEEQDKLHRHMSHLYALFPGHSMDESFKSAAEKVILSKGDSGTGWSLAWKLCLWAKLGRSEKALTMLNNLLCLCNTDNEIQYDNGGIYPNMLAAHPPFQIDANFGVTAGIANMLLDSNIGKITLLPALPDEWKCGSVSGLCAIGNVVVDIKWTESSVSAVFTAHDDTEINVNFKNKTSVLQLVKDEKTVVDFSI